MLETCCGYFFYSRINGSALGVECTPWVKILSGTPQFEKLSLSLAHRRLAMRH